MAEKLTVQCPYCNFMMVQVTECKDLIVSVVRSKRKGKRDG